MNNTDIEKQNTAGQSELPDTSASVKSMPPLHKRIVRRFREAGNIPESVNDEEVLKASKDTLFRKGIELNDALSNLGRAMKSDAEACRRYLHSMVRNNK